LALSKALRSSDASTSLSATRGAAPLAAAGDSTLRRRTVIQGQTAVAGYRGSS